MKDKDDRKIPTFKLRTWEANEIDYSEFKSILAREGTQLGDKINQFIADYIKKHGDGNPQFTLEQFEDPNFIACPAFYRDKTSWNHYMSNASQQELDKLKSQIILLDHTLGKFI